MNKTMKVIDLLNKKADGEEIPKKILFEGDIFELDNDNCYIDTKGSCYFIESVNFNLSNLNDTVEIIEDEDINIQSISELPEWGYSDDDMRITINELVQAVKYLDKTKEDR